MSNAHLQSLHAPDYQLFIELLVRTRKNLAITQRELAKRLGKPPSFVGKFEKCERRLDLIEFLSICRAMHVNAALFLENLEQLVQKRHA